MNEIISSYFFNYLNNSSEAIIIVNTEFKVQFISNLFMHYLNLSHTFNIYNRNFSDLIDSEEYEKVVKVLNEVRLKNKPKSISIRINNNSKDKLYNIIVNSIKDNNNQFFGYFIKLDFIKNILIEINSLNNKRGIEYFENFISIFEKHFNTIYFELGIIRDEQKNICNTLAVTLKNELISNFSYSIKDLLPKNIESNYYIIDITDNYKHHILYSIEEIKRILIYPIYNTYKEIIGIISLDITNNETIIEEFVDILSEIVDKLSNRLESYINEREMDKLLNKLETKKKEFEQIIYITSHDLRSPLVNIQGFTSELNNGITKLLKKIEDDSIITNEINEIIREDIDDSLMYIKTSIEKMDNLLNGLLRLSRLVRARLNYEMLDITSIVKKVLSSFPVTVIENITINIKELPNSFADKIIIEEIIEHLLSNALRYLRTDRKGVVTIWGKNLEDENIYCIEDNGVGIDKSKYEKIFEMFYKIDPNKSNGIGIGLTISKKMLERHKGKIWVESSEDNTKFYFTLPAKEIKNE